jgi:uncharacterized protein YjdB
MNMKKIRLFGFIFLLVFGAVSLTTCAGERKLNGIAVSPASPSIPAGLTQQFNATGYYNDQTTQDMTMQVTWSSSNTGVATINSSGLATAVAAGTTTITASTTAPNSYSGTGTSGITVLTVTAATLSSITVTPTNLMLPVGVTQQLAATGTYSDGSSYDITTQVLWSSSDPFVAPVSSGGLATGKAAGVTTAAAQLGSTSGSTTVKVTTATLSSISITPADPILPAGVTEPFRATGTYSDGTNYDISGQVSWASSDPSVATINSGGLAATTGAGTATITAVSGSTAGSTGLTVTSATLSSISVTPSNPSLPNTPAGVTQQLTATGTYSDGSTHDITPLVTWTSSNTGVATISSNGLAAAVAPGTANITATSGSISGSTGLSVISATLSSIIISPANPSVPSVPVGGTQQFMATGAYADGSTHDITPLVTWTSSNTGVAAISSSGLAAAVAPGTANITATSGSISGSTPITVTSG